MYRSLDEDLTLQRARTAAISTPDCRKPEAQPEEDPNTPAKLQVRPLLPLLAPLLAAIAVPHHPSRKRCTR